MTAPALTQYVTGSGSVTGDMLNSFEQTCDTFSQLRAFVGTTGMQVFARGTSAPNDGGQGAFYWSSNAVGPDDNFTVIIPPGAASGGWIRLITTNAGFFYAVDTGALNAMAITLPAALSGLPIGTIIFVDPAFTTTAAAPTLSVNGVAPQAITSSLGATLANGAIQQGVPAEIMIGAGRAFWLLNPGGSSLGPYATAARGQLPGTNTNDNAIAGNIGEFMSSNIPIGSAISLSDSVAANITSITLTPGDWDVWGNILGFAAGGSPSSMAGGVTTSSGSIGTPAGPASASYFGLQGSFSGAFYFPLAPIRASLNANTPYYLVGQVAFAAGTVVAYGFIAARRVR